MPSSSPRSLRRSSRSSLDAVESTRAPGPLGHLDRGDARRHRRRHGSAPSRRPCSRPNSKRQSSAVPKGTGTHAASSVLTPSGIFQAKPAGTARRSACEPSNPTVTARSPTANPSTSAPTSATVPAAWYPTMWGTRGHVAAEPAQGVAALDAHRLDVDQDVARHRPPGRARPRNGTPSGVAGLVVNGSFHTRSYSLILKRFVWSAYHRDVCGSWVAIFPAAFLK